MAIDPHDLDPEHWQRLVQAAERSGRSVEELIREALNRYLDSSGWLTGQETAFKKAWDNEFDSVFDDL